MAIYYGYAELSCDDCGATQWAEGETGYYESWIDLPSGWRLGGAAGPQQIHSPGEDVKMLCADCAAKEKT
jgi:hypothetical protein